jgi:hypothetical protein
MISIHVDPSADVTVFSASGDVTGPSVIEALRAAYGNGGTYKMVFDLRYADTIDVLPQQIREFIETAGACAGDRVGGKSAVVTGPLKHEIGALGEEMVRLENAPFEVRAFTEMDSALAWLGVARALRPDKNTTEIFDGSSHELP